MAKCISCSPVDTELITIFSYFELLLEHWGPEAMHTCQTTSSVHILALLAPVYQLQYRIVYETLRPS
jgi:hypothetical protein